MPSLTTISHTPFQRRAHVTRCARMLALSCLLLIASALSAAPAIAELPPRPEATLTAEQWVLFQFKRYYGHGMRKGPEGIAFSLERIRDKYIEHFNQMDYGESGIRREDEDILLNEEARNYLSNRLAAFHRKDKNGDLKVTREELLIHNHKSANQLIRIGKVMLLPSETQSSLALAELLARDMQEDLNQDGIITIREVIDSPQLKKSIANRWRSIAGQLLPRDFDSNEDGAISMDEYQEKLLPILNRLDRDGDGEISQGEKYSYDEERRQLQKDLRRTKR